VVGSFSLAILKIDQNDVPFGNVRYSEDFGWFIVGRNKIAANVTKG